ncbi:MAG: class II glutamine amidotransferase [Pseudomonadota bacterium]
MCELLGMECNVPTDIGFSFTALSMRGGQTGAHSDGWGLALYEGSFARLLLEPTPACDSALARYVRDNPIRTLLAIAHVRKRTVGAPTVRNTHPFKRVLWGRDWTFAHNGTLPAVRGRGLSDFTTVGDTDSEHAFCWMMSRLREAFPAGYPVDRPEDLWRCVGDLAGELGAEGTCNFLLADGSYLYARCATKLCHLVRQSPFGRATLRDADVQIDFAAVTTPDDRVVVVATEPLTRDETWTHGAPGTLWIFRAGRLQATLQSRDPGGRPERPVTADPACG